MHVAARCCAALYMGDLMWAMCMAPAGSHRAGSRATTSARAPLNRENHQTVASYHSIFSTVTAVLYSTLFVFPASLQELEADGVKKFAESFDSLLATLQGKVAQLV